MKHWAGTLQSARPYNSSQTNKRTFNYLTHSSASLNSTSKSSPRFKTRVRFPADLLTWRNVGQREEVKNIDGSGRSVVTVAGISAVFFCCTITVTVVLGVFCRKRNTVFAVQISSDIDDDQDFDDSVTSKNFHHHHHQTRVDSTECVQILTDITPGPLQLSPAHTPDIMTQSSDENDAYFADNPLPVACAHARTDISCCCEADVRRVEVKSSCGHSVQITTSYENTYCNAKAVSTTPSLLSSLHKPHLMRSLDNVLYDVINSRWIHRQRVPAASVDQSAASDTVDLTSLLPTV